MWILPEMLPGPIINEVGEDIVKKPDRTSEIISLENDIRSKYKYKRIIKMISFQLLSGLKLLLWLSCTENGKISLAKSCPRNQPV